jgi:hypothetical protein
VFLKQHGYTSGACWATRSVSYQAYK